MGKRYQRGNQNPYIEERTDNTMGKRKKYERTNNDLQNIHIKLNFEYTNINYKKNKYI